MRGHTARASVLCVIWILAVTTCSTDFLDFNEPKRLEDGILVVNGGEMKTLSAIWTIIVSLEAPTPDNNLWDTLDNFKSTIENLHHLQPMLNGTYSAWMVRIAAIQSTMTPPGRKRARSRRGLLDFIGVVSNKLFGTATEAQVDECRRQLERASVLNQRVAHSFNELVTIVNQSRSEISTNRKHISDIESYLDKLQEHVHQLELLQDNIVPTIYRLARDAKVSRILSAIEASHHQWLRQHDQYVRRRAALELGRLTEEILPPTELEKIRANVRDAGRNMPSAEWFYEHVTITPFWENKRWLVFMAALPVSTDGSFLRYRIRTWPILSGNGNSTIQIEAPNDVALDTTTGEGFIPHSCVGVRPAICRPGAIVHPTNMMCPRGIINGDERQRRRCRVKIRSEEDGQFVDEFQPGNYAVRTRGETLIVYCPRTPEQRRPLVSGTYILTVKPGCRVASNSWMVTGLEQWNSNITIRILPVELKPLNLTFIEPFGKPSMVEKKTWGHLSKIKSVPLDKLMLPTDQSSYIEWGNHGGHVSWSLLTFIIVAVVVGVTVLMIWKGRKFLKPFHKQKPVAPEIEVKFVKHGANSNDSQVRIYPEIPMPPAWAADHAKVTPDS